MQELYPGTIAKAKVQARKLGYSFRKTGFCNEVRAAPLDAKLSRTQREDRAIYQDSPEDAWDTLQFERRRALGVPANDNPVELVT